MYKLTRQWLPPPAVPQASPEAWLMVFNLLNYFLSLQTLKKYYISINYMYI